MVFGRLEYLRGVVTSFGSKMNGKVFGGGKGIGVGETWGRNTNRREKVLKFRKK